nr:MAG TPA: hypothetical protein [Caudoviricetes sp.]
MYYNMTRQSLFLCDIHIRQLQTIHLILPYE